MFKYLVYMSQGTQDDYITKQNGKNANCETLKEKAL